MAERGAENMLAASWTRWPWPRCRAVWHKGARNDPRRCDLRHRHDGPHLSSQGFDDLYWIEKHVAAQRYRHLEVER